MVMFIGTGWKIMVGAPPYFQIIKARELELVKRLDQNWCWTTRCWTRNLECSSKTSSSILQPMDVFVSRTRWGLNCFLASCWRGSLPFWYLQFLLIHPKPIQSICIHSNYWMWKTHCKCRSFRETSMDCHVHINFLLISQFFFNRNHVPLDDWWLTCINISYHQLSSLMLLWCVNI